MKSGLADSTAAPFELSGGHPALDFVNSLDNRFDRDGPTELLSGYADLLRFAEQTRLLDAADARLLAGSVAPAAATRVLRAARELREALAGVLYARLEGRTPLSADILVLERRFRETERHRELRLVPASGHAMLHWVWGQSAKAADFPLLLLADCASQLLLSDAVQQVRGCDADTCRWLFRDTSKNHTRRWCNMKVCGNRAKARRFHNRQVQE